MVQSQKMTKWMKLCVPYVESRLAQHLGAEWARGSKVWMCSTTAFKSKAFKRWRSKETWSRKVIHLASGAAERTEAKARRCSWDPDARVWYIETTGDDALSDWHRTRLAPPPAYPIRVEFEEREAAKARGVQWAPDQKQWVFRCHGSPPKWVMRRLLTTV
jgi:hypothetical protein